VSAASFEPRDANIGASGRYFVAGPAHFVRSVCDWIARIQALNFTARTCMKSTEIILTIPVMH